MYEPLGVDHIWTWPPSATVDRWDATTIVTDTDGGLDAFPASLDDGDPRASRLADVDALHPRLDEIEAWRIVRPASSAFGAAPVQDPVHRLLPDRGWQNLQDADEEPLWGWSPSTVDPEDEVGRCSGSRGVATA